MKTHSFNIKDENDNIVQEIYKHPLTKVVLVGAVAMFMIYLSSIVMRIVAIAAKEYKQLRTVLNMPIGGSRIQIG